MRKKLTVLAILIGLGLFAFLVKRAQAKAERRRRLEHQRRVHVVTHARILRAIVDCYDPLDKVSDEIFDRMVRTFEKRPESIDLRFYATIADDDELLERFKQAVEASLPPITHSSRRAKAGKLLQMRRTS